MSNLKWTITYCRLFVWTLFQHPGNLISSADFTSFEFFLEFWPIFSCFATKYFALYMKMSKKFQKSADFLEFCRQCPRIFCPLLGTVRYWELLLNKNGREAEFCPLLGAFPLLGSALLGALSVPWDCNVSFLKGNFRRSLCRHDCRLNSLTELGRSEIKESLENSFDCIALTRHDLE